MNRAKGPTDRATTLLFAVTVLAPLCLFGALAWVVAEGYTLTWERRMVEELEAYEESEPLRTTMAVLAAIGGDYSQAVPLVLVAGAVVALTMRGRFRDAAFVAAAVAGAMVTVPILKAGFERPPIGSDPSTAYFPSGHATGSASVVAALSMLSSRTRWGWRALWAGAAFVLAYGISLVSRGSHYPLDVVAGWCLGLAWVGVLALSLHSRESGWGLRVRRGTRHEPMEYGDRVNHS